MNKRSEKISVTLGQPDQENSQVNLDDLHRQHWSSLCKFLNRTFGAGPPDPEDIAQAAFEKIAVVKNTTIIKNPRAFLYTIARNFVLEHKRRSRTHEQYIEKTLADHDEKLEQITPERILIERQRLKIMEQAIAKMHYKQRRILKMSRFAGKSYREIATETGWSLSDIARQINDAMAILEEALERGSARPLKRKKDRTL